MRVLVLASWFPNQVNSLKGIFIREQVQALRKSGLKAAVFYPFDEQVDRGQMVVQEEDGVIVYRCNTLALFQNRYIARIASYVYALRLMKRIVTEFSPDIIHSHVSYPAGILAYLFTRRKGMPYVLTEHMSFLQDYLAKLQHRLILKRTFEGAAAVIPVSPFLAEQVKGLGWKVTLHPLPNVVDTDKFKPCGPKTANAIDILFIGFMDETEVKGVGNLLPAFASVLGQINGTAVKLHLVGDGAMLPKYEQMAKDLAIDQHCVFYGRMENSRLPELINQCDFFVLPSLRETFGCVLLEAMACGKPVLATACGGPESFINDEVGILVQPGSISALSQGLLTMAQAYNQYNSKAIRQYVVDKFSQAAVAQELKGIYSKIMSGDKG